MNAGVRAWCAVLRGRVRAPRVSFVVNDLVLCDVIGYWCAKHKSTELPLTIAFSSSHISVFILRWQSLMLPFPHSIPWICTTQH